MNSPGSARGGALGLTMLVGLAGLLSGCTPESASVSDIYPDSTATSFVELAEEQLAGLDGVADVSATKSPRDPGADPAALDGLDAVLWDVAVTVTMVEAAPPEQILAAAEAEVAFSETLAEDGGGWRSALTAGRETTTPEEDVSSRRALGLEVFPPSGISVADLVNGAVRLSQSQGVDTVSFFRGRASVTSVDAEALGAAYAAASSEPLLTGGGDYSTTDGRLMLAVLAYQVSPSVIHVIIEQAVLHPAADVALVSPLVGPSAPSLFVNKVSADEASAMLEALTDSTLADDLLAPFTIPIAIRSGAGDVGGFVGGVDPTAP